MRVYTTERMFVLLFAWLNLCSSLTRSFVFAFAVAVAVVFAFACDCVFGFEFLLVCE